MTAFGRQLCHVAVMVVLFVTAFTVSARAALAVQCGRRADIIQYLTTTYQEKPAGLGITANGKRLTELFVAENGNWTLLMSSPQGMACIVATGSHWQNLIADRPES